jgi:hypothetical protein
MDIDALINQIKFNCNVSDARYWGYFSICGLLTRLRELYRNEHALMPWGSIPRDDMSTWIKGRESLWEDLQSEDLRDLRFDGITCDPFDIREINSYLSGSGYFYGAGFGAYHKDTFFLAELSSHQEVLDYMVFYLGKEFSRDLSASPAMLQGRCIYIRSEVILSMVWDKFEELKTHRYGGLLEDAFSRYGITKTEQISSGLIGKINSVVSDSSRIFLLHEIGEAFEDDFADEWLELIRSLQDRHVELYFRAMKDIVADTSEMGPLKAIIGKEDICLLGLFLVYLDSLRKKIFHEILEASPLFFETRDWSLIESARTAGHGRIWDFMGGALEIWRSGKDLSAVSDALKRFLKK